ncbi:MAG: hypothetical protein Q9M91_01330 [Candidatus Dojkabacteria bacterium]|nr:hypothetical protein [Candidatus Dojkabacteria bacterium]MDQ7020466.1 hypothetical protein [Candidatus Dojkabacteria bacterium]
MKKLAFTLYSWGSTLLFIFLVLYFATVEDFQLQYEEKDLLFKIAFRITLYSLVFILIYRSLITTLKHTVERLSSWRSKREHIEDLEFVLIIETLILLVSILASTLIAILDKWMQYLTTDSRKIDGNIEDLFVSILAIILAAIIVYSMPVIGELEYAIKHRFEEVKKNKVKKK